MMLGHEVLLLGYVPGHKLFRRGLFKLLTVEKRGQKCTTVSDYFGQKLLFFRTCP